jgi:hypothetical protein
LQDGRGDGHHVSRAKRIRHDLTLVGPEVGVQRPKAAPEAFAGVEKFRSAAGIFYRATPQGLKQKTLPVKRRIINLAKLANDVDITP